MTTNKNVLDVMEHGGSKHYKEKNFDRNSEGKGHKRGLTRRRKGGNRCAEGTI